MKKILNRIYCLEEKIGKQNFILLGLIIVFIIITGLYQTFSLFTSSEGISLLDGIKTFKFILGADNVENSVTITAGDSKNIAITVSNNDKIKLQYGVYYTSSDELTNVELGYKHDTDYLPNGLIDPSNDYVVTIQIDNNSSIDITVSFGIIYGLETGGDLTLAEGQQWLEQKWNFPLNEVEVGSYVKYIGNNGCAEESCRGQNANYVDDTDMGYCNNSSYKYIVNGWRVEYINGNYPYLISAGSPECLCTSSAGNAYGGDYCDTYETTEGVPQHLANLSNAASKYCNVAYSFNELCNSDSAWNMNELDFKKITGNDLVYCHTKRNMKECGYENTLIDNRGLYWYSYLDTSLAAYIYYWHPYDSRVTSYTSIYSWGVRPVLKLHPNIIVKSGSGTYEDPYTIDNPNTIKDLTSNMNNGVNHGASWDQENGTITTDGSSSYIVCGLANYDFGNQVSLVVRIKFNDIPSDSYERDIFNNFEDAGLGLFLYNSKVHFSIRSTGDPGYRNFYSNSVVEENVWYTIVGVFDGANISLYVNGEKATLASGSSTATGSVKVSPAPISLGVNSKMEGTDGGYVNATYSDALIFKRVLTESEISSDYAGELNPINKENLLLYYDFKR